ncbi:MAG: MarC family protein [Candidatus Methanomethylophilaceae archaeon]|nr:MarC family protein [Candidatus Methanomethylophilaceae archaeon]MDD3378947.1 MarC family protein [Candidatus Methanomethylophilaceae archaeon]MDY0224233.1 MarC family protein [Candidatus Methanomethylophilaceae archaeon]
MDVATIITLSVSLFFILDPFASLPVFLSITKGLDDKVIKSYANKSILVAAILLFVFMFVGPNLMDIFGTTMESFRVAGGLILILMSMEIIFGLNMYKLGGEKGAAWIIIATPILTGPGVITASVIFSNEYGILPVIVAGIIALTFVWMVLRGAPIIMKYVGEHTINILSKIIGLLIAAMGVEYVFRGTLEWIQNYGSEALSTIIPLL